MSTSDDDIFGPESDSEVEEVETKKRTRKTKAAPKPKKKKKVPLNNFMKKLQTDAKKMKARQKDIDDVLAYVPEEEDENVGHLPANIWAALKSVKVSTPESRRKKRNAIVPLRQKAACSEPILVLPTDLEEREKVPDKCKIERKIWIKRTRYYPFDTHANKNMEHFYTNPTNLCCIWCTEQFTGIPIPLPHRYMEKTGIFYVSGQFCSFPCMLAQSSLMNKNPVAWFMLSRIYGIKRGVNDVGAAPSPQLLKKFGGCMSIEAFRATSQEVKIKHREIRLPFIPFSAGIEEVERVTTVVYEYGDESRVRQVSNMTLNVSTPIHIENSAPRNLQRSRFSQLPTIEEQIAQSENKLRLELQTTDEGGNKKKKTRTLMDFMNIKGNK